MQFFKKLLNFLGLADRSRERGDNPFLTPPDFESLKRELKIVEEAKRHGVQGFPPAEATRLTDVEEKVRATLESERHKVLVWAESRITTIQNRLSALDITKTVNRSVQCDQEFERAADSLLNDKEAMLKRLESSAREREAELRAFKEQHRLEREGVLTSAVKRGTYIVILLLFLIGESVVNANFFAANFDGGFIDGFVLAFVLACVNIGLSFAWGRIAFPYIHHVNTGLKVLGGLSFFLALTTMISVGLLTSHLRDALVRGVNTSSIQAAQDALQTLRHQTFEFADIMSLILFVATLGFGLIAFVKGYTWTDRYPGFSRHQKRRNEALDLYEDQILDMRNDLMELKEDFLEKLEADVLMCNEQMVTYQSHLEDKRNVKPRLASGLNKAEMIMVGLVQCYRTENQLHRNGGQVPPYFHQSISLLPIKVPSSDTSEDEVRLGLQQRALADLIEQIERIRARIQSSFNQKYNQLIPLKQHIGE